MNDPASQYAPSFTTSSSHPPTLLDPKTGRAVRALCWTLCVILWLWLLLGVASVLAFIVGVVNT